MHIPHICAPSRISGITRTGIKKEKKSQLARICILFFIFLCLSNFSSHFSTRVVNSLLNCCKLANTPTKYACFCLFVFFCIKHNFKEHHKFIRNFVATGYSNRYILKCTAVLAHMNVILLSVVRPMVAYNIYAFFHSFISIYSFKLKLIYLVGNGKF